MKNKCEECQNKNCIVIEVPYSTNQNEDLYDTIILDDNLKVIKSRTYKNRYYYDKDRTVCCSFCKKTEDNSSYLKELRKMIKKINPSMI
jgi:hypothetical protein